MSAVNDYRIAVRLEPGVPQLWANLALMLHQAGKYSEAIASFVRAHRLNPSLYVPNLFLGIEYAHTGRVASAIAFLVKAEDLNGADPQAPLALGRAYISMGRFSDAVLELDRATKLAPNLGTAWFALGIAHLDLVEGDARIMTERNRQSPFADALYAESLQKQARFGEAVSVYKGLLDARPQPPCLRSELGFALLHNHDPSAAEEQFTAERNGHPECSLAMLGQVLIAIANSEKRRAVDLLEELWNRDPGFVKSNAGILLDAIPNDARAAAEELFSSQGGAGLAFDLRKALSDAFGSDANKADLDLPIHSRSDDSAETLYKTGHFQACARQLEPLIGQLGVGKLSLLSDCAFSTGDDTLTLRAANQLKRLQPGSVEALYWAIRTNERLAQQSLARFEKLDPDSATSHLLLGDLYLRLERNDDAQTEYLKALKLAPDNPAILFAAATAYLHNGNLTSAASAAQSTLSQRPDDPDVNLIMAEVELGRHDYVSALRYLKKSLHARPQMLPRVHALIGRVYAETDKTSEAIQELKLGVSSDDDGSIQYLLARLYRKRGDIKDADAALDRMKTIKAQRRERGYKLIEDPELSALESQPERATTF